MKNTWQKYQKLALDASSVGFEAGRADSYPYFCTPAGARIIGWAGVDGIHFCFVRGFGETVFCVSPMAEPGDYVHPVAETFADFLRLLLACGDTAALEQARHWDEARSSAFLRENPPSPEARAVLDAIASGLGLTPMPQPFVYIRALQASFDYRRVRFTRDYYDLCEPAQEAPAAPPPWRVSFEGSFWGHKKGARAGREIPLNTHFDWSGEHWLIPAAYACGAGLVVDLCAEIPKARIRAFMDRWNLDADSGSENFSDEEQMTLDAENPLSVCVRPQLLLDGRALPFSHGCSLAWNPLPLGVDQTEAQYVIDHYGLDPSSGWVIQRFCFPWATKRRPSIRLLRLTLAQEPVSLPGPHFRAAPGDEVAFTRPASGGRHTLTVRECERQIMDARRFGAADREYPTHFTTMTYTLSPDLPGGVFRVEDCAHSDRPRRIQRDPLAPAAEDSVFVAAVIGGADGPTAVFLTGGGSGELHAACSALHFEPPDGIEWRMIFSEKPREDVTVELVP